MFLARNTFTRKYSTLLKNNGDLLKGLPKLIDSDKRRRKGEITQHDYNIVLFEIVKSFPVETEWQWISQQANDLKKCIDNISKDIDEYSIRLEEIKKQIEECKKHSL